MMTNKAYETYARHYCNSHLYQGLHTADTRHCTNTAVPIQGQPAIPPNPYADMKQQRYQDYDEETSHKANSNRPT
jgi:hypothetical protein